MSLILKHRSGINTCVKIVLNCTSEQSSAEQTAVLRYTLLHTLDNMHRSLPGKGHSETEDLGVGQEVRGNRSDSISLSSREKAKGGREAFELLLAEKKKQMQEDWKCDLR